ncbi:MAG: deoxyguanosinetriphosphate triphosphohydrolase [Defluviitaleaceae bacterium]|nr:deoxyguanosinetriphosphate triphosphohydrolase [Defluviitaleaceae bacterium]
MTIREKRERWERECLSSMATKSADTQGRKHSSKYCDIRTEFQRDRDRITHSKAFRRLMHKTQVFISPEGDHYRTRLTHTMEVAQIARTISSALSLNEDLTEAIALGHDLGHTPFGHTGEDALNHILPDGFRHNEQSVRVVELLENDGAGLNLTFEVIDGILNHRTSCKPATFEGQVVQISDKIAYMNHDVDDAVRAGILNPADLPESAFKILGATPSIRIDFLVHNLVEYTQANPRKIALSPDITKVMGELRSYMFKNVYVHQLHSKERSKIDKMIHLLFEHYMEYPNKLPKELQARMSESPAFTVADYIAGMTDRFALKQFSEIFMPNPWAVAKQS